MDMVLLVLQYFHIYRRGGWSQSLPLNISYLALWLVVVVGDISQFPVLGVLGWVQDVAVTCLLTRVFQRAMSTLDMSPVVDASPACPHSLLKRPPSRNYYTIRGSVNGGSQTVVRVWSGERIPTPRHLSLETMVYRALDN